MPQPVYAFEYRVRKWHMHKPMRPSGLFYGPGWQFSIDGVPVCTLMNVDNFTAVSEFVRLSDMIAASADDYEGRLTGILERNRKKVR